MTLMKTHGSQDNGHGGQHSSHGGQDNRHRSQNNGYGGQDSNPVVMIAAINVR